MIYPLHSPTLYLSSPPLFKSPDLGLKFKPLLRILQMEMTRLMAVVALILALGFPSINAQVSAPAPAPTSDGVAIDQGIAYVLMLVALAITYIIH
ncbi:PREDICTED: arabinogalactan peptide 22-like [Ipomoea nil]|uniref:arabinogalactan peptide 22-like n=1 Tax=Ipomoea nil TaxID=35883 RepID=UPI000901BAE6|nr:PREDICTED: arabinogalactan peptide 22-like [Ipomoea nil]